MMNDGYLQHMRVGACAGLGTKYLAREEFESARDDRLRRHGAHLCQSDQTSAAHRSHARLQPDQSEPRGFRAEMTEKLDIEVIAVDSPEKALKGADIVSLTTDSLVPVIKADWLEPGMHINNVRNNEAGADVSQRADVIARLGTSTLFADRSAPESPPAATACSLISPATPKKRRKSP